MDLGIGETVHGHPGEAPIDRWNVLHTEAGSTFNGEGVLVQILSQKATGRHYVEVTVGAVTVIDLAEDCSRSDPDGFEVPALKGRIHFGSTGTRDAFCAVHAECLRRDVELRAAQEQRVLEVFADALRGEEELMSLGPDDVDSALLWFESLPDKALLATCLKSVGGAKRDSLAAHRAIAGRLGSIEPGAVGTPLWNVKPSAVRANPVGQVLSIDRQKKLANASATGVEELKQELSGLDARHVVIEAAALPGGELLPRREFDGGAAVPGMNLLDIACGAGKIHCFMFLVNYCGMKGTAKSMRQALGSENTELVRDVWNRLDEVTRDAELASFASVAASYHNYLAFDWLIGLVSPAQLDEVRAFVVKHGLVRPFVKLVAGGLDVARIPAGEVLASLTDASSAGVLWIGVLKAAAPARLDAWLSAFARACPAVREELLRVSPAPEEFQRLASLTAKTNEKKDPGSSYALRNMLVDLVLYGGRMRRGREWRRLLEFAGVGADEKSLDVAVAMRALGIEFVWTPDLVLSARADCVAKLEAPLRDCLESVINDAGERAARGSVIHSLLGASAILAGRSAAGLARLTAKSSAHVPAFKTIVVKWAKLLSDAGVAVFDPAAGAVVAQGLLDKVDTSTRACEGIYAEPGSVWALDASDAINELNSNWLTMHPLRGLTPVAYSPLKAMAVCAAFKHKASERAIPKLRECGGGAQASRLEEALPRYLDAFEMFETRRAAPACAVTFGWCSCDGLRGYTVPGDVRSLYWSKSGSLCIGGGTGLGEDEEAEIYMARSMWQGLQRFAGVVAPGEISPRKLPLRDGDAVDAPPISSGWWFLGAAYGLPIPKDRNNLLYCLLLPNSGGNLIIR
jgi:hypothetical protein